MRFGPGRPRRGRFGPGPLRPRFRAIPVGAFGAPGPRRPAAAAALQYLRQANSLLNAGQYDEAADIFGQLASMAEERGRPAWAGNLHLLAGQALGALGERDAAMQRLTHGLGLLAALDPRRATAAGTRAVNWLRAHGQPQLADEVQRHLSGVAGSMPAAAAPVPRPRGALPASCPQCGGAIHPDEVEWVESEAGRGLRAAAECPYCGSLLYTVDEG